LRLLIVDPGELEGPPQERIELGPDSLQGDLADAAVEVVDPGRIDRAFQVLERGLLAAAAGYSPRTSRLLQVSSDPLGGDGPQPAAEASALRIVDER
jgi:hypothetical protein